MPDAKAAAMPDLFAPHDPALGETAFTLSDLDSGACRASLLAIAAKIGRTRRPGSASDVPAGATYLAQFAVHDLDFRSREERGTGPRLDLGLIYGDGPRHDAFCYQTPAGPGQTRSLLRLGRCRPTAASPAWGAARDLPRASCPHLDGRGTERPADVLVPNAFSDSNLLLGQMQTLWALLHNAAVGALADGFETRAEAFEAARRIVRHVYRGALLADVVGTWTLPRLRGRYAAGRPALTTAPLERTPPAFLAGVARLGHGLVREIYALNDRREVEGLRDLIRHTSVSRPADMPLTEDWLVDFSRFFDLPGRKAQRARGIGPHVARPFALGGGVGLDVPTQSDGLVLRDLVACARAGAPSVRTLVARIAAADPGMLEGCFAQDERRWTRAVGDWLADAGLPDGWAARLAADPPLTLFLMLEAEADAEGRTLGALGSILMAETLTAALPDPAPERELRIAETALFAGPAPASMAELILFLQRHHAFADGARLHAAPADAAPARTLMEKAMLDDQTASKRIPGLIQVADYIEFGRLVTEWATGERPRPATVAELRAQLDGIAVVPDDVETVEFVQGDVRRLVVRLPDAALVAQSREELGGQLVEGPYMLPKFYDDIYQRHFGPQMTPLEIFLARVGDYTIAKCR